jgi:hypothetical protein
MGSRRARFAVALGVAVSLTATRAAVALVRYDEGRLTIHGVTLLQDFHDATQYYYLPQFPRLSTRADGTYELLCLKYVDQAGGTNGGLFHALVEFTLPPAILDGLEKELTRRVPGARIAGAVPLTQAAEDGPEGLGSFRVVSAVLSEESEGGFARRVITSGRAPLMPGSKAVVAALLNQNGATLLWDSLSGPTSDVSVAIHGSYEAAVEGYNARVSAEMTTIYEHFSRIVNVQQGYSKRQLRDIVDELHRDGALEVEVLDRSKGLGIDTSQMDSILQLVTDKLTELMFDYTAGWAVEPEREVAVEADQLKGRQERSWLARAFGNRDDTPYYTDDQYVIKRREDIRSNTFSLVLSQNTTIKVAVDTAGNLSGVWSDLEDDPRYFRIVNLDDPAFEFRTIHFQIDGNYVDSFTDTINFVSVNVRKTYGDRPSFTRSLHFSAYEVGAGATLQEVAFPRLGESEASWTEYEYQVRWSVRDRPTLTLPAREGEWIQSSDAAVSLVPPFEKREIEIDADRQLFTEAGVASALFEVATVLAGEPRIQKKALLRSVDAEALTKVAIYYDRDTAVGYRLSWNAPSGTTRGELLPLESDYLFVVPPQLQDGGDAPGGANR